MSAGPQPGARPRGIGPTRRSRVATIGVDVGWTFFYLMVILKIPIVALLWIVWWAINATDEDEAPTGDDDGGLRRERHPRDPRPRPPRRGPHGDPPPPSPPRARTPAVGRPAHTPERR